MTQKKYWAERGYRKTWPSHVSSLVMNGGCEQWGEYTADHEFSFSSGYSKSLPFLLLLPRKKRGPTETCGCQGGESWGRYGLEVSD